MMIVVLGMALSLSAAEATESKTWATDYSSALAEVQRTDKPLFIVFDGGSSVTGQMVAGGSYMSEQVEQALSADYVRMFVDTETEAGQQLAAKFAADSLPRVVVIDRSGEWQVYRRSGTHSPDQVLSVLTQFRRSKLSLAGHASNVSWSSSSNTWNTVSSCGS